MEIFARGIRNTVGFDWNPATSELWFTDNGRDWLGDNAPPDELNRAPRAGLHFGYPPGCEPNWVVDKAGNRTGTKDWKGNFIPLSSWEPKPSPSQ